MLKWQRSIQKILTDRDDDLLYMKICEKEER